MNNFVNNLKTLVSSVRKEEEINMTTRVVDASSVPAHIRALIERENMKEVSDVESENNSDDL